MLSRMKGKAPKIKLNGLIGWVHENVVENEVWCSVCAADAAQTEHQIHKLLLHSIGCIG